MSVLLKQMQFSVDPTGPGKLITISAPFIVFVIIQYYIITKKTFRLSNNRYSEHLFLFFRATVQLHCFQIIYSWLVWISESIRKADVPIEWLIPINIAICMFGGTGFISRNDSLCKMKVKSLHRNRLFLQSILSLA